MKLLSWKKIWLTSSVLLATTSALAGGNLAMQVPHPAVASFPVPVTSPVYHDIDVLSAFSLIHSQIIGQRPWSAHEIARLLDEAERHLSAAPTHATQATELIARSRRAIAPWISTGRWFHPVQQITADVTGHNQPERRILANNGLAGIIAEDRSFRNYTQDAPDIEGISHSITLQHAARLDSRVTCLFEEAWRAGYNHSQRDIDSRVHLQQAHCQAVLGGVALNAGREPLVWGQSDLGGILISGNTRPLDQLRISSAHPFYHPWLLRYLGPSKYSLFVARLSDNPSIPHPLLFGSTASIRPHRRFEFGFFHTYLMDGQGSPSYRWFDPLTEFFFVRSPGASATAANLADHRAGINLRWEIPGLRGTSVYADGAFEDFGRANFLTNVLDMSGYILGIHAPRLDRNGRWGVRVEYRDIPPALYRHGIYLEGYTNADRLLGDPLGPDGRSLRISADHEWNQTHQSTLSLWGELIDSNTYTQSLTSAGIPNRVVLVADNPSQLRLRGEFTHRWNINTALQFQGRVAYQQVRGDNFVPGVTHHDVLASAQLQWTLGK